MLFNGEIVKLGIQPSWYLLQTQNAQEYGNIGSKAQNTFFYVILKVRECSK